MADRRIDQLTALATVDSTDLFPVYDNSASTTKKSTLAEVKTSLALTKSDVGLGDVDNTSDANKPVSSAQQAAIDAKVEDNLTASTTVAPSKSAVNTALATKQASLGFTPANSTTTISAGSGLTGGGDLSANRTLALDINGLTAETSVVMSDTLPMYDVSEAANNKATIENIFKAVQIVKAVGGSAQTTTLDTAVDITNMSFAIGASQTWTFEAHLQIGCNNTGGVRFAVVVPSGATFRAHFLGMSTGVTGVTVQLVATSGTFTGAFNTVNSQSGWIRVFFTVVNSTNAGDVKLQFSSVTSGQTSTIHPDSFFVANRIA